MPVFIGSPTATTTVHDLIMSIRDQIPDPVSDPAADGAVFSVAALLRWINKAGERMCQAAPIIEDWYAIPSEAGMDVYELPNHITNVLQLWYDLNECVRQPELDALGLSKVTARSYYFGPHSSHIVPRLHVWPAADRSAATTTLTAAMTATQKTVPMASVANFNQYGFVAIDSELILYRTLSSTGPQLTQILRGQGGTLAASHNSGAAVQELNIFFKCNRLPATLTSVSDVFEVPRGLYPIIELYVLAEVRNAEQEFQEARALRQEFDAKVNELAQKNMKLRQGMQVRVGPSGPLLYGTGGRVFVP